jgi:hypothetical protein
MSEGGHHPILETRLRTLETRIGNLRQKLAGATGIELIEDLGAI